VAPRRWRWYKRGYIPNEKKVLLIEDSALDIAMVTDMLSRHGFAIESATTAKDGYAKAVSMKPDLILLDLMLPDGSGFDLCRKIRSQSGLGDKVLIVVLSIKNDLADIEKAFEAGADDYVVKPPAPGPLLKKVQLYLG
jgi:DNA-binding response OmpR family regulator